MSSEHSISAYVYPNGEVYSAPQMHMSDDYFVVDSSMDITEIGEVVTAHFGETEQAIHVMIDIEEIIYDGGE